MDKPGQSRFIREQEEQRESEKWAVAEVESGVRLELFCLSFPPSLPPSLPQKLPDGLQEGSHLRHVTGAGWSACPGFAFLVSLWWCPVLVHAVTGEICLWHPLAEVLHFGDPQMLLLPEIIMSDTFAFCLIVSEVFPIIVSDQIRDEHT